MKTSKHILLKAALVLLVLFPIIHTTEIHAQPPPPFQDFVDDSGAAPINGLVGLVLLLGAYFGVRKLRKEK
jgi:hypothetical protein